ncbi:phospho-sugar mutase [Ferviditalea candida]|uniref:phosphoglucomutase (alpha-D-glucose-1,6-bisphosphate-dependent) n=1 Tax=Ferviditalea candida TaxID=3108399 RepID=A0ABU5ZJ23_9BACL|nr:phospho-sugar mutase [Paenibacillaceae bacterium T2]
MNHALKTYQTWLNDSAVDEETKNELRGIADQPNEIEERFYKDLEFGTGGLRGVIGAGTNRMNRYSVARTTQGLADYLKKDGQDPAPSVVIAYDSRNQSPEFALEAALVCAGNGIKAYVFESLRPTPELSFFVRRLQASAGVVITASHNPPEYNGYKVYDGTGCQLVPELAEKVTARIREISSFGQVHKLEQTEAEQKKLLVWLGSNRDQEYIRAVASVSPRSEQMKSLAPQLKIIYTPLHGSGNRPVRDALDALGFTQVSVVSEQEHPDPGFSTVASPNPEEKDAFAMAIRMAEKEGADLIIGTDPDCDRMGAVVRGPDGKFEVLTGNQSGALMIHYLLSSLKETGALPDNGAVVKTIVTSEMGAAIADRYGVQTLNTLTGFKYIGELMTRFERDGSFRFLFGYEESYGYLAGNYARDKDAVLASALICEAAAYYKGQGKSLYDVLQELYRDYGYFKEALISRTFKGKDGVDKIHSIMEDWRSRPPHDVDGTRVVRALDYLEGIEGLRRENVMKFVLEDGSWFCLRPSGTEPKIKIYLAVRKTSNKEADQALKQISEAILTRID